jgi:alanyl-tRNA synthetase
MSSEKLYYGDSYCKEFSAKVERVMEHQGKFGLILDKTYFYPETGGQLADCGEIENIKLVSCIEKDGEILHLLEKSIQVEVGAEVKCKINWEKRFDNMQQHTGQHILSSVFVSLLQADTISSRLGEKICTIDLNRSSLNLDELSQVEELANQIVFENREVKKYLVNEEEAKKLPLRKPPIYSENIRIVEIENLDWSACGGTHLNRTGEVGIIKILNWERMKGNVRVNFICGKRGLEDFRFKNEVISGIAKALTRSEKEIENAVILLLEENKQLKRELNFLKEKLLDNEAKELFSQVENLKEYKLVIKSFSNRGFEELKNLAIKLANSGEVICILGLKDEGKLILSKSKNLSFDLKGLAESLFKSFNGKGGGGQNLYFGSFEKEKIEEILNKAKEIIKPNGR